MRKQDERGGPEKGKNPPPQVYEYIGRTHANEPKKKKGEGSLAEKAHCHSDTRPNKCKRG